MSNNTKVIQKFYDAFKAGDAETMASCYHPDVQFEDPVFRKLSGDEVGDMWRMLLSGAKNLHLEYFDAAADGDEGSVRWHATYTFSKTGRTVHNKIKAHFKFKDGKIIEHKDSFNFWKWSRMALGPVGIFLGFTPFLRNKVSAQTLKLLKAYREKRK
ncbi:nuclear transport factor 2 family protein [Fulvivirga kasyanovii]